MSQLLERLRAELTTSTDPVHRAACVARIAAYCARIGKFDDCRACIADLRSGFGEGQDGRVTIWIMLAEGLLQLYGELSPSALDRITRAQLLAMATKYEPAIAVLSAWKAHIEFELAHYDAMFKSLSVGMSSATDEDPDAQTRLAMVISNLCFLGGDREMGQQWFMRGRDVAIPNGDQASIEALLYNRVAFKFADLRAQYCRGRAGSAEIAAMRVEVESAVNLQGLIRAEALTNHIRLIAARLLVLEGHFEKAMEKLQEVRLEQPFAAHNFSQQFVDLEVAMCLAATGKLDDALALYNSIEFSSFSKLDLDERLVIAWNRKHLSMLDHRFGEPSVLLESWQGLSEEYGNFQSGLLNKVKLLAAV